MVDTEGLSDLCLLQIGMVTYDTVDFEPIARTLINVDPKSTPGKPSVDTVMWWAQQSAEAQGAVLLAEPKLPLGDALRAANAFYRENKCTAMWSHMYYDQRLLSDLYTHVGIAPAWGRKGARDLGTLFRLNQAASDAATLAYKTAGDGLVGHVADEDCVKQIRVMKAVMAIAGLPK